MFEYRALQQTFHKFPSCASSNVRQTDTQGEATPLLSICLPWWGWAARPCQDLSRADDVFPSAKGRTGPSSREFTHTAENTLSFHLSNARTTSSPAFGARTLPVCSRRVTGVNHRRSSLVTAVSPDGLWEEGDVGSNGQLGKRGPQLPLEMGSAEGARRFPGEMETPTCSLLLQHCFPLTPFSPTQRGLRSLQGSPTQHGGWQGSVKPADRVGYESCV